MYSSSDPNHAEVIEKINLYIQVARYEVAEKTVTTAIENHPGHEAEFHNLLGFIYHKQSKFQQALDQFKSAMIHDPNFIEATLNYAVTLCDLGKYAKAQLALTETTHQIDNRHSVSYQTLDYLGKMHENMGDQYHKCAMTHRALAEWLKASEMLAHPSPVVLKMAEVYITIGNVGRAEHFLKKLLHDLAYKEQATYLLGTLAYREGDIESSMSYWANPEKKGFRSKMSEAYGELAKYLKSFKKPRTSQKLHGATKNQPTIYQNMSSKNIS
ncbi:MAG: tetratricopeptide repeat protein [Proteobacteria bacterium]|nr:tetratricopeptide repeat protein [Pseudomonadota bacterium]